MTISTLDFINLANQYHFRFVLASVTYQGQIGYMATISHITNSDDGVPELNGTAINLLQRFRNKDKKGCSADNYNWIPFGIAKTAHDALDSLDTQMRVHAPDVFTAFYQAIVWNMSYYFSKTLKTCGAKNTEAHFKIPKTSDLPNLKDVATVFRSAYIVACLESNKIPEPD